MATQKSVLSIFSKYLSSVIPKSQLNIFYMLFNGIDNIQQHLERLIQTQKKERNFLTATENSSLRSLASQNGFVPQLLIPSQGQISIQINPKLFARVGYPLYITPNSVFLDKVTNLRYYFDSDKVLKIENGTYLLNLVEGFVETISIKSDNPNEDSIFVIKLKSQNISDGSLKVSVGGVPFTFVDSFFDNDGLYDNKQFLFKHSNVVNEPIALYVKGVKFNDVVDVTYKLSNGELGNTQSPNFTTDAITDSHGNFIDVSADEISIKLVNGFNLGSNGTTKNALKSAIGFNHSVQLLFDSTSYTNYLNKFSLILQQKIVHPIIDGVATKSINNIYCGNKQYINTEGNTQQIKTQYNNIVTLKTFNLSVDQKINLSKLISEKEYALSSHNLKDMETNNYAVQILFENQEELEKYSELLEMKIYNEFSIFLYDNYHEINFDKLINNFVEENKCKQFSYTLFDESVEREKIKTKSQQTTNTILTAKDKLPILKGNFMISDNNFEGIELFFNVNIVSKQSL